MVSDPLASSLGNSNLEFNLLQQQSSVQQAQLQFPQQPSMFRRILGGAAGMAGNMFAPGLGSALGNVIGGGGASAALAASGFAQNAANLAAENQILAVTSQADENEEKVELAGNLMKSKHSTFMAVIQNIT